MKQLQVMPSATGSEENILGSIILNGVKVLEDVLDVFGGSNPFYDTKHSEVYDFIKELYEKGYSVDLIVLTEQLKNSEIKNRTGDAYYFVGLTNKIIHTSDIQTHCRIVFEAFQMRRLIEFSGKAMTSAFENSDSPLDVISELEKGISSVSLNTDSTHYQTSESVTHETMVNILKRRDNPDKMTGIPSGFKDVDAITGGWQSPDLIIIAARPSVGKSAFAINCAYNAAVNGSKVALFSLEMSNEQVMQRMLSMSSLVKLDSIRKTNISEDEVNLLTQKSDYISSLPLYFDDTAGLNIYQLRSKVRNISRKHGLDMIIIDYLQLMSSVNEKNVNSREQEISKISRDLKNLAKELEIPIIALSQLSRAIESRTNPEPRLSDLRESGAIEQDADFVGFLARPDYQKVDGAGDSSLENKAVLFIRKHRNGRLDDVVLSTDLSTQRFLDNEPVYSSYSNSMQEYSTHSPTTTIHDVYDGGNPF